MSHRPCHVIPTSLEETDTAVVPSGAAFDETARLTKTTMVWELEVPWTMVTVAVRLLRLLLIRRLAGIVYISETTYPERASSLTTSVPALTEMIRLHEPAGILLDLVSKRKVKLPLTPSPLASLQICRRPLGLVVGVGEPFGVLVGVAVGAPFMALV